MHANNYFRLGALILLFNLVGIATFAADGVRGAATTSDTAALKVVTSISPLADVVKNVGGPYITVTHFVPLDVDPHTYEPTFSSLRAISQAEIIFLNGDGLDRAARENLAAIRNGNCQVVDLSRFIPDIQKSGADPHYWLDLKMTEYYVRGIAERLSALAPAHARDFQSNAEAYLSRMRMLDSRFEKAAAQLPASCKTLVLYHNAWTYTATRYGFTVAGIIEQSGTHEPSARKLAMLIKKARALSTRAIVAEPGHGSRILQTVKEEARIPVLLELVEDSLRQSPYDTYLGMMEANLGRLCRDVCRERN